MKDDVLKAMQDKNEYRDLMWCYCKKPELIKEYPLVEEDKADLLYWYIYEAIEKLAQQGYKDIGVNEVETILKDYYPSKYNIYQKCNGSKVMTTASETALIDNIQSYYASVKKYTILRQLYEKDIDISEYYGDCCVDPDEAEKAVERFLLATPSDILKHYKDKYSNIVEDIKEINKAGLKDEAREALTPKKISSLERANEPIEYLIDGWIKKDSFNSIIGAAKAGKTVLTMAIAFCVQNGIPFLGFETKKADVLYVDFELEHNEINKRFNLLKQFYEVPDAEEFYYISASRDFANGTINMENVIDAVKEAKKQNPNIKLCIFDCYYTFAQGDGNTEEATRNNLRPLKGLVDDMCVCYVHHTNKTSNDMTNLIYAAGGSGVHGKIVDSTIVVWSKSEKDNTFNVATTGRSGGTKKLVCKKDESTYHQFKVVDDDDRKKIGGKIVEKNPKEEHPDIWAAVSINGADVRTIAKRFEISGKNLAEMGFRVDYVKKKVYRN